MTVLTLVTDFIIAPLSFKFFYLQLLCLFVISTSIFFSLAGVSRSVTIVVAYVMTVTDLGWRDSFNAVRGARSCASPNCGFQRQLLEFQHESLFQVSSLDIALSFLMVVIVTMCVHSFIHYGDLYSALQGYYSEVLSTLARLKRRVLRVE